MTPKYVIHDNERWRVIDLQETHYLDEDPAYGLRRGNRTILARQSECVPDDRPRKRRLRHAGYVLEFDDRGTITIREHGRRKRFTTSLGAIYSMTVKAATLNRKPSKRVRRGLLSLKGPR